MKLRCFTHSLAPMLQSIQAAIGEFTFSAFEKYTIFPSQLAFRSRVGALQKGKFTISDAFGILAFTPITEEQANEINITLANAEESLPNSKTEPSLR